MYTLGDILEKTEQLFLATIAQHQTEQTEITFQHEETQIHILVKMWTMTLYLKAKSFHTALIHTKGHGF